MLLAELDFTPRARSSKGHKAVEDEVYGLLGALRRNGQLWGEAVLGWKGGKLRMVCSLPHPDALESRHHSQEGTEAVAAVRAVCAGEPRVRVVDDRAKRRARPPNWRSGPGLYLFTTFIDETSPVCHGGDGAPVALYLLPIGDEVRRGLSAWAAEYARLDALHVASGLLEREAYRGLVDLRSSLTIEGRSLAREVERATGRPTYYYLMRYRGRRNVNESRRPCPDCGGAWRRVGQPRAHGLDWFDFRCEPCRLLSHMATWA